MDSFEESVDRRMIQCRELKATRDSKFLKGHLSYHSKFIV
ncbi:hypothetical protein LEP1GSC193_2780 [Leptospira alstonii serovar Pingchang str. 80-412]|nr:hypothetical protein LEP1GSC193_2780 [Leptospira alstonii serovar Pingchang str. 80-412]